LVSAQKVLGKKAHDTRLVATMQRHGLTHLLTFNSSDFQRFTNIVVLNPTQKFSA